MRRCLTILLTLALVGCATHEPIGVKTDPPVGPDGTVITNNDRYAKDMQRLLGIAASDPDIVIEEHVRNPAKRPTVKVKYSGEPPRGLLQNIDELSAYRHSHIEGDTVVYDSDLGQMTMILERHVKGKPYDYRELTAVVPYGYCLDFIEENMGKHRNDYILRSVKCDQDNLGHDY